MSTVLETVVLLAVSCSAAPWMLTKHQEVSSHLEKYGKDEFQMSPSEGRQEWVIISRSVESMKVLWRACLARLDMMRRQREREVKSCGKLWIWLAQGGSEWYGMRRLSAYVNGKVCGEWLPVWMAVCGGCLPVWMVVCGGCLPVCGGCLPVCGGCHSGVSPIPSQRK